MAPLAFLSYTRKDDEFFGGYITEFRKTLENAVHVVSGSEAFKIFQDVEGIVIGESWKKKLSDVISASSFFVPMVSPLFLSSEPCRDEVNEFLEHERSLGRDDLILPVYFLVTAKLEKHDERDRDPVAKALASRQMFDWREKALLPLNDPAARRAVLDLAQQVAAATERLKAHRDPSSAPPSPPPSTIPDDAESQSALDARIGAGVAYGARRIEPSPRTVLWVDDMPGNNVVERRALESYGLRFEIARDTESAKRLLAQRDDLVAVISDMGRPGDSRAGITLLEWLRAGPQAEMPYFIYTSRRAAKRRPAPREPAPHGITADPDRLVQMVIAAVG